jgi:succinate dehydrogenase / fumarate reductase membrane anchor subunit
MTRVRSLGTTHRGVTEFLVQRVSSMYLGGFVIYAVIWFIRNPSLDYAAWSSYMDRGIIKLAWGLFFVSLLAHTWTGLRSVYMDYLHPTWLRFSAMAATALVLIALGLWSGAILLKGIA